MQQSLQPGEGLAWARLSWFGLRVKSNSCTVQSRVQGRFRFIAHADMLYSYYMMYMMCVTITITAKHTLIILIVNNNKILKKY